MKAAPEHSLIRGDIPDKHSHGNVFGDHLPSTRGDQKLSSALLESTWLL